MLRIIRRFIKPKEGMLAFRPSVHNRCKHRPTGLAIVMFLGAELEIGSILARFEQIMLFLTDGTEFAAGKVKNKMCNFKRSKLLKILREIGTW